MRSAVEVETADEGGEDAIRVVARFVAEGLLDIGELADGREAVTYFFGQRGTQPGGSVGADDGRGFGLR